MPGGEEWLLAPAAAGMCKYESLKDGTLDLADVALMNDFFIMRGDNEEVARNLKRD